ncbi:ABC transporter permease subunit [Priestia megaterium]|uniref:ABC transporter permease subunit n=1 Tax=Priestia megaterium TaxID=1404 RepID=UPI000BF39CC5|nr:ABC transporter permease subunit [Priestia megaterium]PFK69162.1 nickel ABC transporter permease subunit NikC [Priestia megaterium]
MIKKICLLLLSLIGIISLFAPWIVPNDPYLIDTTKRFFNPSWQYPLGTDHLGRCIFSRILIGMRYSVGSALIIQLISSGFSLAIATIVTFRQGITKKIFIRLWDILLSFPIIILAFALISVFGPGSRSVIIALVFAQTIYYSRIFHNAMISLSEMNYIKAARVSGTTGIKLLKTHFIPHILPTLYTLLSLDLGKVILEIAGFSFIGLGVQAPIPEWGMMIDEGKQYMRQYPALIIYPGISIFMIVLLLHQVGVKKHAN